MTNEQRWQAVLTRDASLDDKFVFGVSSTHIFCRPSCPSRRAKRARISFFPDPQTAEQAGFRACKRCHPGEAGRQRSTFISRACELMDQSEEPMTLAQLSSELGISSFHLQRTFKRVLGITPRQYAETRRSAKFKDSVREGQPITAAMYDAGYGSSSRLYERSASELGMSPATYSRNGLGAIIRYSVTRCELGWLLVAATEKGICSVKLGSSETVLEKDLKTEFSAARIELDRGELKTSVKEILEHLSGNRATLNLSLDLQATAFQRLVWEALRAIPYGSTRSYREVAKSIGRPSSVRAVARACATNPVAVVIPCHRVIGSDKSLSGYRWGLDRKRRLLEQEQQKSQGSLFDRPAKSGD